MNLKDVSHVQKHARALLEIKGVVNEEKRIIEGIATTPTPDRAGDIVDPKGAEFKLPFPLLYQHDSDKAIGNVIEAKVTDAGIRIRAQIERAADGDPVSLKERLDVAWAEIKKGLVRGLSIGFIPLESARIKDTYSFRFTKWELIELSVVTIPMNAEAGIENMKSAEQRWLRAASGDSNASRAVRIGNSSPGVTGHSKSSKGSPSMATIREHIQGLEATRQAKAARMLALAESKAGAGETLGEDAEEFDALKLDVEKIDADIKRYGDLEKMNLGAADPITKDTGKDLPANTQNNAAHYGTGMRIVPRKLPPGTAFTRYVQAIALSKGVLSDAVDIAQRWKDSTPEVLDVLQFARQAGTTQLFENFVARAAVAAGTTTDTTFASPLIVLQTMADEFIDLLRPATILGRIPNLRRVPFNIRVPRTTSGATGGWVGEGSPKPVNAMALDSITMGFAKVAVISVLTEELVRFSNPSSEDFVRTELINALTAVIDTSFVDPNRAAVANVSPASITNGASLTNSTGTTIATAYTNVGAMMSAMAAAGISLDGLVWLMNPRTAIGLSMLRTTQDVLAFPTVTPTGGTFFGAQVIVSGSITNAAASAGETYAVLMQPREIYLADDGGFDISTSREASVQMNDAPSAGAASLVSFWQNNLVGIRAERMINWRRRRDAAVQVWDGLRYA